MDSKIVTIPSYYQDGIENLNRYVTFNENADSLPFTMSKEWYEKLGKNESSNRKRDFNRSSEEAPSSSETVTLGNALNELEGYIKNEMVKSKKDHMIAVLETGRYILQKSPLPKTQGIIKVYRKSKNLDCEKRDSPKLMYERLKNYIPVSYIVIKGVSYIVEKQYKDIIRKVTEFYTGSISHEDILEHVTKTIGPIYKDTLEYLDTKRDRDALKGVVSNITSIRFASKLQQRKSRSGHRNSLSSLEGNLGKFQDLKKTSQVVRNDMTPRQQHELQRRIISKRKIKELKTIAKGRGATLKVEQFPELPMILEGVFGENGLESHPRLTDEVLYRANSSALKMKDAREALLALSPKNFSISLSCCYNYTQNFKSGTAEAKRHHEGKNINACISLHAPPRIDVEHISPNLHWTTSNVNNLVESMDGDHTIFDSKDAKCKVCADISPVQRPGKTWKKRGGSLLDHEWNQSRVNAVTPMTHLFLETNRDEVDKARIRS